jgi:alkaline phosphatase D
VTTHAPTRRRFIAGSATAAGATLLVPAAAARPARGEVAPRFAHGVASGDPRPDGVLLWTRVTPTAGSRPGSGEGPDAEVRWTVFRDAALADPVATGTVTTGPDRDHTVKADVRGLEPETTYWYRFGLDGAWSRIGRTRTAPAPASSPDRLRFGLVSCSNWQAGFFAAYRHLAERGDLDLVVHVGDYLYEYPAGDFTAGGTTVRPHTPANEMITLADYRRRHAQYKTDRDLQALHARLPWAITWDDHESANDAWARGARNHTPSTEGPWRRRIAAARQAYHEWMPIRSTSGGRIYRRLRFGTLADLSLLDLRSYRSRQVSPLDGRGLTDPGRTITGARQLDWVVDGLSESDARWRLIGNSVMISPVGLDFVPNDVAGAIAHMFGVPEDGFILNADAWDGYTADRRHLLTHLGDERIRNTVFLTGDIHSSWACDVPEDAATYPFSPSLATEIVTTSVTSDNVDDFLRVPPRSVSPLAEGVIRAVNRHVGYTELDSHGYVVVDVTAERTQADWYHLADRTARGSGARRAASLATVSGTQRLRRVRRAI